MTLLNILGIQVIKFDAPIGCYVLNMMIAFASTPEKQNVNIVKLGYLKAKIRKTFKHSIIALIKGNSNELFERLAYNKFPRLIHPLDYDFPVEIKLT